MPKFSSLLNVNEPSQSIRTWGLSRGPWGLSRASGLSLVPNSLDVMEWGAIKSVALSIALWNSCRCGRWTADKIKLLTQDIREYRTCLALRVNVGKSSFHTSVSPMMSLLFSSTDCPNLYGPAVCPFALQTAQQSPYLSRLNCLILPRNGSQIQNKRGKKSH